MKKNEKRHRHFPNRWRQIIIQVAAGRAIAVCAHNALGNGWQRGAPDDSDADQETARFLPSFSPWCWGTWRGVWETVLEPQWDWYCS